VLKAAFAPPFSHGRVLPPSLSAPPAPHQDCDFYVRMRSGPIIEHSASTRFAPYHFQYPGLPAQLAPLGLTEETDTWCRVEDFNWLRAQQSPNWAVLPEDERAPPVEAPQEACGAEGGEGGAPGDEM
jgi:hypothetical protein